MLRLRAALIAALAAAGLACAAAHVRPWAPLPAGLDEYAARETLRRFAVALEAGRFEEAHALLSARWRAAYDPARLALDFAGTGPLSREMAARVLARLAERAPIDSSNGRATMRLGGGGEAVVVADAGSWRVDALE